MNRLSPTQLAILQRLSRNSEFIHRCTHGMAPDTFFYNGSAGMEHVSAASIRLLEKRGLVEDFEKPGWRWRGSKYRITDAGRLALKSLTRTVSPLER